MRVKGNAIQINHVKFNATYMFSNQEENENNISVEQSEVLMTLTKPKNKDNINYHTV